MTLPIAPLAEGVRACRRGLSADDQGATGLGRPPHLGVHPVPPSRLVADPVLGDDDVAPLRLHATELIGAQSGRLAPQPRALVHLGHDDGRGRAGEVGAAAEGRQRDDGEGAMERAHRGFDLATTGRLTSDSFETTLTRTMPATARAPRVYEQIVGHIERAIYEGRLRQGQKLPPERQLARDLKASRVAVREALRTLELRGLVDVRQGSTGGYFVREVDDRQIGAGRRGPVTEKIQQTFFDVIKGKNRKYEKWLTHV